MLHAARASVHHSSARAPDAGKAFLELRDLAGEAEPDAAAGAGRRVGNDRDPGSGAVTGPGQGPYGLRDPGQGDLALSSRQAAACTSTPGI